MIFIFFHIWTTFNFDVEFAILIRFFSDFVHKNKNIPSQPQLHFIITRGEKSIKKIKLVKNDKQKTRMRIRQIINMLMSIIKALSRLMFSLIAI